jgi:RNA:NAD 2'-phosphotransferase (TPT1/KptA family)
MPLLISSGWSVQVNRLMSDVFCQDASDLESQKILLLVKEYPQGRFIFVSLEQSLNISGQVTYTLAITRDKQDEPIKTYKSTDKEEMSLIVEQWMEVAHRIGIHGLNTELLAPARRS